LRTAISSNGSSGLGASTSGPGLSGRRSSESPAAAGRSTAPNREELERRLRARGTESEGEIEERLAQALEQSKLAGEFSYTIVNDDLDRAIDELEGIVRREIAAARA